MALAAALTAAACSRGGSPPPQDGAVLRSVSPVPSEPERTAVPRRAPAATPTPEPDPLSPVESAVVPGVPVPYAAQLVLLDTGQEGASGSDWLAEYLVPDAADDELRDWFLRQMPEFGWDEGEDRDGALLFRHTSEPSAREGEGAYRAATIVFARRGGVSFSILAEPAAEGPPATPGP
jgi:hypothetical protein